MQETKLRDSFDSMNTAKFSAVVGTALREGCDVSVHIERNRTSWALRICGLLRLQAVSAAYEQSIKDGGVAGIPTSYYRKALDLNRFSNTVANKLLESYRRQIVKAVRELERIDKDAQQQKPQFKAARMRA